MASVEKLLAGGYPPKRGPREPWHDGLDLPAAIEREAPGFPLAAIEHITGRLSDSIAGVIQLHAGKLLDEALLADLWSTVRDLTRISCQRGGIPIQLEPVFHPGTKDSLIRVAFRPLRKNQPKLEVTTITAHVGPREIGPAERIADRRYDAARERAKAMTVTEIDDALNLARVPEAIRDEIIDRLTRAK